MKLSDVRALVTGGESGIGAATVRRLQSEGARVLAAGLQDQLLAQLARETEAEFLCCDVTDQAAVSDAVRRAAGPDGRLDIVVNAAGIMVADNVADIEDEVWERLLAVNLTGTMRVCRAAIPYLLVRG